MAIDTLWDNARVLKSRFYFTNIAIHMRGGNNIIVDKSVFHDVCEGVRETADIVWVRQHSGIQIKKSIL